MLMLRNRACMAQASGRRECGCRMAVNDVDHRVRFGSLFETYGALLTKKQQQCLELYFCEDYSLAEIAEEMQVSRQAIHDLLKRVEQTLEHYETILGFLQRIEKTRELTKEAAALLDCVEKDRNRDETSRLREILHELGAE